LGEAAGHGETEADAAGGVAVAVALERREHRFGSVVREAGSVVADPQFHLVVADGGAGDHGFGVAVGERVGGDVGDDAFEQAGVGQDGWGGVVDLHGDQVRGVHGGQRGPEDLVVAHGAQLGVHGPGGQPGRVEQVGGQRLEPVGAFFDRGQLGGGVGRAQVQRGVAEATRGGLDRGQGCAQVVAHRGEQGAAQLGGLRAAHGGEGVGGQPLGLQGEQGLAGDPAQDVVLGGGQVSAGEREVEVGGDGDVGVGRLGGIQACRARGGDRSPPVIVLLEQDDRGGGEGLAHLVQQQPQRVRLGHDGGGEFGE
jgi:hypothetical protein